MTPVGHGVPSLNGPFHREGTPDGRTHRGAMPQQWEFWNVEPTHSHTDLHAHTQQNTETLTALVHNLLVDQILHLLGLKTERVECCLDLVFNQAVCQYKYVLGQAGVKRVCGNK